MCIYDAVIIVVASLYQRYLVNRGFIYLMEQLVLRNFSDNSDFTTLLKNLQHNQKSFPKFWPHQKRRQQMMKATHSNFIRGGHFRKLRTPVSICGFANLISYRKYLR